MKYNSTFTLYEKLTYQSEHFLTDIIQNENGIFKAYVQLKQTRTDETMMLVDFISFENMSFTYIFEKVQSLHLKLERIITEC